MTILTLRAPMAGWCSGLDEVPDPVFAEKMAGDGVAIEPTAGAVHAPCDGEVVAMKGAKHAVTIRTASGEEVLIHVGIDTVQLEGAGFAWAVAPGQHVKSGDLLLRFDLDLVARRAKSAVTPVLVVNGGEVRRANRDALVAVGDFLAEIEIAAPAAKAAANDEVAPSSRREARRHFGVPFEHGLHARPAALVAAALKPFDAEVSIHAQGRNANARSTTAMMALGVRCGDTIEVVAVGAQAEEAVSVLATLLALPQAPALPSAPERRKAAVTEKTLVGVIACRGIAIGRATPWSHAEIAVDEAGRGAAEESEALKLALARVRAHLVDLASKASGDQNAILSAHVELVDDPDLHQRASNAIARGKSAGHAWRGATRTTSNALDALDDPRMRERAADLRDLENQVLRVLIGKPPASTRELPHGSILLADELLPSQLASLDRTRIAGIVMARGGATSHVAIIAASLGIPALVAAGPGVLEVAEGTHLILDAENGRLDIDPAPEARTAMQGAQSERAKQEATDRERALEPGATKDGTKIAVYANLGSAGDARTAVVHGAEGCGLLRTEFLFLDRREPPGEDEQVRAYQEIATAMQGRPLTIRTMDIGGDKPIAYLPLPREENPALGLRGVRTSLWKPGLLRTQLRAILRVSPASQVRILLPMVTDVEDVRVVREMIDDVRSELGVEASPPLGVMIETPASAMLADQLVEVADFLSIGTNDLSQYTLAMDRGHPELASRLDAMHPAVLRLIAVAADAAQGAGKEVAVCGSLGSDVAAIPILVGLGVHEVSVVPTSIPRIKRTLRSHDLASCKALAHEALEQKSAAAVRKLTGGAR
ncbi:phosphoenolpyruvate--protein phosphotransferase [Betaproteobacteria bacterium GR16-43]|nr:phosphoenolpyruvate--protein phosphotransferase [Betaproteobacteria bacterium GR16-43]